MVHAGAAGSRGRLAGFDDDELAHHPGVFVEEQVAVVHVRHGGVGVFAEVA